MSTRKSRRGRKRRLSPESPDSPPPPISKSPKKRRRRTLQLSQESEEDNKPIKQTKKSKKKVTKKSKINTPTKVRTPKPLKLTEAKSGRPLSPPPPAPLTNNNNNNKKVSSMNKTKKSSAKKKPKSKSRDIRNFFAPCSAADFFGSVDKPNINHLKKQSNIRKQKQNKQKEKEKENFMQNKKKEIISLVIDCSDDNDIDMKTPEICDSNSNKPLKRRKSLSPSSKINGLNKFANLNCDVPVISDYKTIPNNNKKEIINNNNNNNNNNKKNKIIGRKRKLDEISNDNDNNKNGDKSNTNINPSNPDPNPNPAKKARYYPGFKRTDAPPQHGKVDIPQGKAYCFSNMRFVITGQLPSLTRDDAKDIIQQYGGRVTGGVSGMTRYLLAGTEAGQSKLAKAKEKRVKVIDENAFFDLLRNLPAGKVPKIKKPKKSNKKLASKPLCDKGSNVRDILFVDKYKPRTSRELIGNNSCITQLRNHLIRWDSIKNKLGKTGKNAVKKGVLLSGQPGIGKTTAINVIASELGYSLIEFNASDTRGKKALKSVVEQSLNNRTMTEFFSVKKSKTATTNCKNLIVMDEVDGMSSGDRGGMQELVSYIKKSKIPIICICNDRHSQKIRTLAGYCLDLKFRKPTVQQISNRLYRIATAEGFECDIPSIQKLAEGTNGDIRQILNLLQFWSNSNNKNLTYNAVKNRMNDNCKDLTMGPWDVTPKLFYPNTSILKGIEYYFVDYGIIPLMVQENYLNIQQYGTGGYNNNRNRQWKLRDIEFMTEAAQSIADGDLIDKHIRVRQVWSLLQYHGVLSSLKPAQKISSAGRISSRIGFPSWLGKFSSRKKNSRLYSEIASHMNSPINNICDDDDDDDNAATVNVTGNIIASDYLSILKQLIVYPLEGNNGIDNIEDVIKFMKMYNISREDWDTVVDLGLKLNKNNKNNIKKNVKSAFTRKCKILLNQQQNISKKSKKAFVSDLKIKNQNNDDEISDNESDDDNNDNISKDNMIKQTKTKTKRGKGRGKSKGKSKRKKK